MKQSPCSLPATLVPRLLTRGARPARSCSWAGLPAWGVAALCAPLLGTAAAAADTNTPSLALFHKPAWLTELSLGVKESYDDSVYMVDMGSLKDLSSWVTTVSPRFGVNFAPLLGDQKTLQVISLGYTPDFAVYHDVPAESYDAHRATLALKGKTDDFSFNAENGFTYINGSKESPTYDQNRNAIAIAAPRERREQYQDRAKITFQYDQPKWFARATGTLLYYDLLTTLKNVTGYDNYCDRYDVNGGVDLGWRLQKDLAVTLGYRYGHQYQQQYSFDTSNLSSPNDYQRVLLGLEGKPWKWLTVNLQGGPDYHDYEPNSATHTTPIGDHHLLTYYGEASLAAQVSPRDLLSFKYKQWQWVSSAGKLPLFDSTYDLTYRHTFGKLALDLGGRILTWDYTCANTTTGQRDDWMFTVLAGLTYSFNPNLSVSASYSIDLGRNAEDGLTSLAEDQRTFERHLVSLGLTYKL